MKHTAASFKDSFGETAANFLINDFYVDDKIISTASKENAIRPIENSRKLCEKGGFHLHKFVVNDKDVRAAIPISEQDKDLNYVNILQQDQHIEQTLGVQWCIENDTAV